MSRRARLFLPLEVTFFDDDRMIAAGDGGKLLYLAMCLKIKALGADGRLSEGQIAQLARPKWRTELRRLEQVEAVIWDATMSTWVIAAWFGHNEPINAIIERRAADADRKRRDRSNSAVRTDSARTPP